MNHHDLMAQRLLTGETITGHREGGNSMLPLIRSRQPMDITPIDREIKVGDIVFATVAGRYYFHLVTAVRPNGVQISNNHGRINGWTPHSKVYGFIHPVEAGR